MLIVGATLIWFAPRLVLQSALRGALLRQALSEHADRLAIERVTAGWRTPIEMHGLRYATDRFELVADSVWCDRTLLDLLTDPLNLGSIRLDSPQVKVFARPTRRDRPGRIHTAARQQTIEPQVAPKGSRAAPSLHVQVTNGALHVVSTNGDSTRVAHGIDWTLTAPAGCDRAAYRFLARTGDPQATTHISAVGTFPWPLDSWRSSQTESHIELVGVDIAVAESLLQWGDLFTVSDGRNPGDRPVRCAGHVTGSVDFGYSESGYLHARTNLQVHDFGLSVPLANVEMRESELQASAAVQLSGDVLTVDTLHVRGELASLDACGVVNDCWGAADANLAGWAMWNWGPLNEYFQRLLACEVRLSGENRRPWRLCGPLRGQPLSVLEEMIELDVETHINALHVADLEFGPTAVRAHWIHRTARFEPIECSFQNGQVCVQPFVSFQHHPPLLGVKPGRLLNRAAIDPKLGDWVLRYINPLATVSRDLNGHLSLEIDHLEIPLRRDGMHHGVLAGRVILEDVEFAANESLQEILATAGIAFQGSLRTSQNIDFRIENGRVHHRGLALPLGGDEVMLDGWVALDHEISIRVSLPVTAEMLGKDKRLYRLLRGQRIEIPVTGTLDRPQVSQEAVTRSIQRLVQTALRDRLSSEDPLRGLLKRALK